MKNIYIISYMMMTFSVSVTSCKKYLDILPDNIAQIDNAFSMRNTAERYLFTCYSWLPNEADFNNSYSLMTADELWAVDEGDAGLRGPNFRIAKGFQGVVEPLVNCWDGEQGGVPFFRAIRECNIFLENVGKVPDLEDFERTKWISEVTFLKAYYHFLLVRMYGPIPITDVNLPISAGVEEVKVYRSSIDSCFSYIVRTIDKSMEGLPSVVADKMTEKGRVDKCVAMSIRAQILVYAASPLFNGNTDYANFISRKDNKPYFNQTFEKEKWVKAANACKEALQFCESNGFVLHKFTPSAVQNYSNSLKNQLSYREALTERTNTELIWGNVKAVFGGLQQVYSISRGILGFSNTGGTTGNVSVPLKMVEMFNTNNGVPLQEDKTRSFANRYNLRTVLPEESENLQNGYITVNMNFNREDRFYGALGFDGGKLFGHGKYNEAEAFPIQMKLGQTAGIARYDSYVMTGYFPKKLINYQTTVNSGNITSRNYFWPIMRLSNLYLLCAEAINEAEGSTEEVLQLIDKIRERSGLQGVAISWNTYALNPGQYKTKEGLREIIQTERTIELMFEGQRSWDLRRWKTAIRELNMPIMGYGMYKKTESEYYTPILIFSQKFYNKDYFWPIKEMTQIINRNLGQNPGW